MARVEVKDIDRGLARLLKRVGVKARMRVGVFGDNAARAAQDGNGATVGDIASAHEFSIPAGNPRSWLRRTITNDLDRINRGIKRAAKDVYSGAATAEHAVDLLGHGIVGMVKDTIIGNIPPALSPEYEKVKARKYPGATTNLIASSQFLGSITHEVQNEEKK